MHFCDKKILFKTQAEMADCLTLILYLPKTMLLFHLTVALRLQGEEFGFGVGKDFKDILEMAQSSYTS